MTDLTLTARTELPDALRVLLAEYPRISWEHDPEFNDLIRFWLDRHLMFRRVVSEMRTDAQQMLDAKLAPPKFTSRLSRFGGMFVQGLHEHHTIEDTYYFPKLAQHDQRIEAGFDILDKDHHEIDAQLNTFVENANAVLNARDNPTHMHENTGKFEADLTQLEKLLDRHLNDEEELIVPVILKFGAPNME
ncbi:MAG: hemerythrin domain-containing protein [Yoonia sp.]|nr:hemerythrin domain-containing protein [Yoonia sp.]